MTTSTASKTNTALLRRVMATLTAVMLTVTLTACGNGDTKTACESRGGSWERRVILIPVTIGKNSYLQPRTIWRCSKPVPATPAEHDDGSDR